jgi:hypothetical protein
MANGSSKLSMPGPHIASVDPESALYNANDDARTLARAHSILRNPSKLKGLNVHLAQVGGMMKSGLKKIPIKGVGIRSVGVKR